MAMPLVAAAEVDHFEDDEAAERDDEEELGAPMATGAEMQRQDDFGMRPEEYNPDLLVIRPAHRDTAESFYRYSDIQEMKTRRAEEAAAKLAAQNARMA